MLAAERQAQCDDAGEEEDEDEEDEDEEEPMAAYTLGKLCVTPHGATSVTVYDPPEVLGRESAPSTDAGDGGGSASGGGGDGATEMQQQAAQGGGEARGGKDGNSSDEFDCEPTPPSSQQA